MIRLVTVHVVPDAGLGNAAYLLDLGDGRALAVDVSRDLRDVDAVARDHGLTIAFAADTHLHADFLTGALDLARRDGARVIASAAGGRDYPHHAVEDRDEVVLGGLRLRALLTPGHTDEHVAFEILDGTRTMGIFTGGSLIVGAAARTDLVDPERTEELARAQYRSIQRLATFDDDVAIWPTHGGGSFCSAASGTAHTTTVGAERAHNSLLNQPDEDSFAQELLGSLGSFPTYFNHLSAINRTGPDLVPSGRSTPPALDPDQLVGARAAGAEIVDARPVPDFSAAHVPGSVSIPLRPAFASWLGWLVDFDAPFVVVRNPDQDPAEIRWQAHKIGYDHLVGEVADGLAAWRAQHRPTSSIPIVRAPDIGARAVLDIRQQREYAEEHLPGAHHVELGTLADPTASRSVDLADGPTVVMCGHGERAMGAASLLARAGHRDLSVLDGGPEDWASATGRQLEEGR